MRYSRLPLNCQTTLRAGEPRHAVALCALGALLTFFAIAAPASGFSAPIQPEGVGLSSGRSVIAAGGGYSSGGAFSVNGTIGQADADPLQPSTGGTYTIAGGFWFTSAPSPDGLFIDGFESQ